MLVLFLFFICSLTFFCCFVYQFFHLACNNTIRKWLKEVIFKKQLISYCRDFGHFRPRAKININDESKRVFWDIENSQFEHVVDHMYVVFCQTFWRNPSISLCGLITTQLETPSPVRLMCVSYIMSYQNISQKLANFFSINMILCRYYIASLAYSYIILLE